MENKENYTVEYEFIQKAKKYVFLKSEFSEIKKIYNMLQSTVSHYKLEEDNAKRLMFRYYKYLTFIRTKMQKYGLNLLENLEKYPIYLNSQEKEYYEKISQKIDEIRKGLKIAKAEHAYIYNIKEFYVNKKAYYEVIFSSANDYVKKTDRTIAFTDKKIISNYATKIYLIESSIEILGNKISILIIDSFEIKIRECEFVNFCKIFNGPNTQVSKNELKLINECLNENKINLLDLITYYEKDISQLRENVVYRTKKKSTLFLDVLEKSKKIVDECKSGSNVIKYLLFNMKNIIIKRQKADVKNSNLSDLFLENSCIPFDNSPFVFSLPNHNPSMYDLLEIFNIDDRQEENLARQIKEDTESNFKLF
ncbi:hypothetical protein [Mycoplasma capricolum]|uniref:Helicase n=1 Tax=Mycoplasma capricolum subsp. capripneumoniae 87001 TaxID=1124992 RepID=A0A9N7BF25_MYCCC|nr:hypothetical protein [Mycoplasma capricolum]AJK51656.1 helicase [Mycoplasma capricolum subsp. capripneumoniae 87001]